MNSINILFLILFSFNLISLSINQFNGRCGYPGKPYRAKLEPDNKLQYNEGEEVTYQCTDFQTFVPTRRCEKGKWTGKLPRCGEFVDGILMKDSKMEDISDPNYPKTIFHYTNMNITNTTWRYPNVFTSNRFKAARLRIFDTKKYKWSFNFTGPAVKLFVRLNFNFINYTFLSPQQKESFTFNTSVFVSPHRKCELLHQSDDIWRDNGRKTDTYFICDSLSQKDFEDDIKNPGNYMFMETQASIDIPHDFIALFFGKSYGTEEEPICGEPEIMLSQSSRFNVQFKDYIIDCNNKYKYTSVKNDIIPETSLHGMKCKADMKWVGSYPQCLPKKPCSLENLLIGKQANKTVVTSFDGLFYPNESVYYAVEGTEVNYGCENPSTDILVGKENRICQKNGLWNGAEPYCYNPNDSSKFPVWLIIGILFCALLFIICLTGSLFYVYTMRIKKRLTKQISDQNRAESEKYDAYDDIDITDHKLYDNTYDVVGDGEVRYAEPYYCAEKDYVQMPHNVQLQSSDSYWRLPTTEPAYLEMTCSTKNSPSQSLQKKTPLGDQIYTYEL